MIIELQEFNNIVGQIEGAYHNVIASMGISDSVFDILYTMCAEGDGCNQSSLYKNCGLSKTTVNSAIKGMEKNGYIMLQQGEGRNTKVFLTDKGKELSKNTAEVIIEMENHIFNSWTSKEQKQFVEMNKRFLEQFKQLSAVVESSQSKNVQQ